jgi:tRNA threonylcarbamoyladenosine biosynthesis protein TsaE
VEISLKNLPDFAARFIDTLPNQNAGGAYVIGLKGELGAGKTSFVQEVAKALGVTAHVTSPTFVIAQSYPIARHPFSRLIHMDAYRLAPDERDTVGWHDAVADSSNLILVEWPERLPWFPKSAPVLNFSVSGPELRAIAY